MPGPYPREFREDVVAVARKRESGVTIKQIPTGFGISEATLQTNVLNQQGWTTRQGLRLAIVFWIERKYHRQRAQDGLAGLTPIEFEAKLTEPRTLAA